MYRKFAEQERNFGFKSGEMLQKFENICAVQRHHFDTLPGLEKYLLDNPKVKVIWQEPAAFEEVDANELAFKMLNGKTERW